MGESIMHPLEQEIQSIVEACHIGNISVEERNYLLQEIKDVRVAQECAGDEKTIRYVVQICNAALSVV
jgi:hypothetical protein